MRIICKENGETLAVFYRSDVVKIDFDSSSGELVVLDLYGDEARYLDAYVDLA